MIKENNKNHEKMYDLIFMDNNMPIMDGYQSTRNIKEFIKNYTKVQDKAREKEDILNRSILKVHEISHILEKLKV